MLVVTAPMPHLVVRDPPVPFADLRPRRIAPRRGPEQATLDLARLASGRPRMTSALGARRRGRPSALGVGAPPRADETRPVRCSAPTTRDPP
ncbi:hypothetical protein C1701_20480 [Actinoalloteichus sp. AHMU CJ021]|nr:hypothetical protein C1701_20480 [Actinoalloteichus sp. AHMU CJ021]